MFNTSASIGLYLILSISIFMSSCAVFSHTAKNTIVFENNVVVAHRGAWKKNNLPENSIASLKHAIEIKCTGSEFDVRMTADEILVINHDNAYNKLSIEKTNYADLLAFKLSNGEKIPTLREYILAGLENNTHTRLVCEIKPSDISKERGKAVAVKVVELVKELKAEQMVVYISFDYDILKAVLAKNPRAITQYLEGDQSPEVLKKDGIAGADYHFSVFQKQSGSYAEDWIASAQKNKIQLNAWTVNKVEDMDWLLANQFDFITTNEPELLMERIKKSPVSSNMKLTWSDEFNYKGLPDSAKWYFETKGNVYGWGNNELQHYTTAESGNAVVNDGILKIIAKKETILNKQYSSARLSTVNTASFKYGRIDVRAKLPAGKGTWPAIWMLGMNINTTKWPECGEIDIMEHVGYDKDSIFGTVHSESYNHMKGTQKGKAIFINNPYNAFHIYSLDWTSEKIDFLVDGVVFNSIQNEHLTTKEWPFDQPFYLILNLAIGGNWGGKYGVDDSIFPATMEVDYVRVFQPN